MSTHAILEVAALSKAFGGVQAVRDVSFAVPAGQMIALLSVQFWLPASWSILSAFILFRIFDIWKPYPIRRLEGLESGLGIMADDIVAGIYALIVNSALISGYLLISTAR